MQRKLSFCKRRKPIIMVKRNVTGEKKMKKDIIKTEKASVRVYTEILFRQSLLSKIYQKKERIKRMKKKI